ncbi:MAG: flagellar hook-basal body complex protein [Planctomycetes bacterium]|nr:flagellar hook-basal body complex protein [Planctomycetota bacterium]
MGLSQSLYTGLSGLTTHQKSIDTLSNNLANVNTIGYKKSDFMFSNLFNQVLQGSMPAADNRASTAAITKGLGVSTGAILNNFTQGPIEYTGNPLDCAINGNGFFIASTDYGLALTRNGSFYLDTSIGSQERLLCVGDGLAVQGWMASNGTIDLGGAIGNIYIPAIGDLLPGNVSTAVSLSGILPSNPSAADVLGSVTTDVELKGNLTANGDNTLETSIYAPVTLSDGTVKDEIQEIRVLITFTGPTLSADGTQNVYSWTMHTVDWPGEGESVQIYPPEDDSDFPAGSMSFHTGSSLSEVYGAGQAVGGQVYPGATTVATTDADGVTHTFILPADFTIDFTRVTNLDNAPGGNELEAWSVNGNPAGSIARTITVYDEFTEFVTSTDANGYEIIEAVRRVEARETVLYFTKVESDDAGTTWTWQTATGDAAGELRYNTLGDLVSSTQTGGSVAYDFTDTRYLNYDASMQVSSQDGYRDGYLQDISIDQFGKIWGHYTNDVDEPLAQLAIGTVANTSGLSSTSGTLFYTSPSSGDIMIGAAGDSLYDFGLGRIGAGLITSMALEGSNVDLGSEFTKMISYERGYQFTSRIVTVSDEMLQTALQMKA